MFNIYIDEIVNFFKSFRGTALRVTAVDRAWHVNQLLLMSDHCPRSILNIKNLKRLKFGNVCGKRNLKGKEYQHFRGIRAF